MRRAYLSLPAMRRAAPRLRSKRTEWPIRTNPAKVPSRVPATMTAACRAGPPIRVTSRPFPTLTPAEIERMRRFGSVRRYATARLLFETGKPAPGMFVVLSGHVAITQRDGLGHVTPVIDQGPGQFLAEIGQLSGRVALVDGHAEGEVETLLIPPDRVRALLVAEAELGERIMRALILRRVSLIQGGVGGPVLIGPPHVGDMVRLQNFLTRNGQPHHVLDPAADPRRGDARRALLAVAAPTCRWWSVRTARCCAIRPRRTLALALGMIGRPGSARALRRRGRRQRSGRPRHRGLCGVRRACRSSCSTRAPSAARPAPARASKTIWAFRPASPARRSPAAPSSRRRNSAPR